MHLTTKQLSLLKVITAANPDGKPVDMDQILERLDYETSKQSLQFSLRALIEKALIEKGPREVRRARERQTIQATELGMAFFPKRSLASELTDPED